MRQPLHLRAIQSHLGLPIVAAWVYTPAENRLRLQHAMLMCGLNNRGFRRTGKTRFPFIDARMAACGIHMDPPELTARMRARASADALYRDACRSDQTRGLTGREVNRFNEARRIARQTGLNHPNPKDYQAARENGYPTY